MRKLFLLLLVVAVGAGGYYIWTNNRQNATEQNSVENTAAPNPETDLLLNQLLAEGFVSQEQVDELKSTTAQLSSDQQILHAENFLRESSEKIGMRWEELKQQIDVGGTIRDLAAERGIDLDLLRDSFANDIDRGLAEINNLVGGLWGEIKSVL